MESPVMAHASDRQQDRRSRTDLFKSFVRSRTPSPAKQRAKETIRDARPIQLPAVMSGGALMLPPDHPHANAVLGEIHNNRKSSPERGTSRPRRTDSSETKRTRPESIGAPAFIQPSPPKRRQYESGTTDKENRDLIASGRPAPIWTQYTSQASLLDQGVILKRKDSATIPESAQIMPRTPTDASTSQNSADTSKAVNGTITSQSTLGSITSTSSTGASSMTRGTSKLSLHDSRYDTLRNLDGPAFDAAFESVLSKRNIPEQTRHNLRALDTKVKMEFIKHGSTENITQDVQETGKSSFWQFGKPKSSRGRSATRNGNEDARTESKSPSKKSMSRGRARAPAPEPTKEARSPSKKPRSLSRPRSLMNLKNLSSSSLHTLGFDGTKESKMQQAPASTGDPRSPEDFIDYLQEVQNPIKVEVGKLHKLRILLRNESIIWIDNFVQEDGVQELLGLLGRILKIEWREEHEDLLLHEVLLCLKGLSTTQPGLDKILEVETTLFPPLLKALFDEDKKGPSEFSDRKTIVDLLYAHLISAAPSELVVRATSILSHLRDPGASDEDKPLDFITHMHQSRPYTHWCREITNVAKEVFWIFMHHSNIITAPSIPEDGRPYHKRHFPPPQAPVPAAPHVGGVEYDATRYMAAHLDLMNGLIASLPTRSARNTLRAELEISGFERLMGGKLRLCREKYYAVIHDAIRTWLAAAAEDGWPTADVSRGPPLPVTTPRAGGAAPKLELPKLDLGVDRGEQSKQDDAWL